ncbi:MAG: hypothetical protein K9N11_04830 [Lentisphaeria bacterium]|nr:hypothetical protein [Candidatus Neomarinimicrobiota bacterium]MCF7842160.1 hypothetical protein [Lentisphaeria bacterium]
MRCSLKLLMVLVVMPFGMHSHISGAVGGYTGTFLRLTPDAVSAGLGGITLFEEASGYAFLHNPAALTESQRRIHAGTVHLPLDRHLYGINYTMELPPTAHLGLGVMSAGTRNIPGRDSRGYYTGELQDEERLLGVAFANDITSQATVGVTLQLVQHKLTGAQDTWDLSASGFGLSTGLTLKMTHSTTVAVSLQNIQLKYNWNTESLFTSGQGQAYSEPFPLLLAAGFRQKTGSFQLMAQVDAWLGGEEYQYRAGLIYTGLRQLALRAGAQYMDAAFLPGFSAGYRLPAEFGPRMQIDYGIVIGVPGEGVRQYMSWEMGF